MGLEILQILQTLGVKVEVIGDRLRFQPASRIPSDLVCRIREEKPAILQALRNRPAICSKEARAETGKVVTCRYDWIAGYRGLRLHCVAHHHAAGTATVFRVTSFGHDVLLEMARLGILTGQALEDARRVN